MDKNAVKIDAEKFNTNLDDIFKMLCDNNIDCFYMRDAFGAESVIAKGNNIAYLIEVPENEEVNITSFEMDYDNIKDSLFGFDGIAVLTSNGSMVLDVTGTDKLVNKIAIVNGKEFNDCSIDDIYIKLCERNINCCRITVLSGVRYKNIYIFARGYNRTYKFMNISGSNEVLSYEVEAEMKHAVGDLLTLGNGKYTVETCGNMVMIIQ